MVVGSQRVKLGMQKGTCEGETGRTGRTGRNGKRGGRRGSRGKQKPRGWITPRSRLKSAPGGIRTPNLLIRSQMLYPLSYGRNRSLLYTTHRKNNKPQVKRIKSVTLDGCAPNLRGNTWPAQHRGTALAPTPHQRGTGAAPAQRRGGAAKMPGLPHPHCASAAQAAWHRATTPARHPHCATAAAPPNNLSSKQC